MFNIGDHVVSNEKYMQHAGGRYESGVVTEVYEGKDQFRMKYPITVSITEEDGTEGLFAEDELDLL